MLNGKKIIIGITGSIAAYKSLFLIRLLVKEGAEVKVIQTSASRDFVTPLSLATLSKHPVLSDLATGDTWANHVDLGRWADVMLIAPLSCNTLAKMAHGLCDNLLLATYLSAVCPVVAAPAMDEDMWRHPVTSHNLNLVASHGVKVIPVGNGELASGLYGDGRMAEPEAIVDYLKDILIHTTRLPGEKDLVGQKPPAAQKDLATSMPLTDPKTPTAPRDLIGKKALVTAGPTYEAIDPVRFIGNHSSGKMGIALAKELAERGAQVDLVLGPTSQTIEAPGIIVHKITSAEEMYNVCLDKFPQTDIAILSAAVADYTPVTKAKEKIKKSEGTLTIELTKTKDILRTLGTQKKNGQLLIGFALETTDGREYAIDKLHSKNADLIVLNTLQDPGAGFGFDTNKVTIFGRDGSGQTYDQKPKQQVAKDIVDRIVKLLYA